MIFGTWIITLTWQWRNDSFYFNSRSFLKIFELFNVFWLLWFVIIPNISKLIFTLFFLWLWWNLSLFKFRLSNLFYNSFFIFWLWLFFFFKSILGKLLSLCFKVLLIDSDWKKIFVFKLSYMLSLKFVRIMLFQRFNNITLRNLFPSFLFSHI